MSFDLVVFIVGLVLGSILLLSVTYVYVKKNKFGTGGTVLALVGVVLVGLFVFARIKIVITGIAELEADLKDTQQAIQTIQEKKDAIEGDLNSIAATLASAPPTGFTAVQIRSLRERLASIRQANTQIGKDQELAITKAGAASAKIRRIKGLPR
jgi:hypothetical protein